MTDDLETFDSLEAVELTIGASVHTIDALRRPLSPRIDEGVQVNRAAWHLRVADLAGDVPALGNTLEAGTETWTVKEVQRLSFNTRYRLLCEQSA